MKSKSLCIHIISILWLVALVPVRAEAAAKESIAVLLKPYVKKVNFFEGGWEMPDFGKRVYRIHFMESLTRYINWEINFEMPPPGRRIDYEVEAVWRRADGRVVAKQKKKSFIEADWTTPWAAWGYGHRSGNTWQAGAYTVEFRIDDQVIATAAFDVLADAEIGQAPATMLAGQVPLCPGSRLLALTEMDAGGTTAHAEVEMAADKTFSFYYYRDRLQAMGWTLDVANLADKEEGALKNKPQLWALLNLTKAGRTVTIQIPADQQSNGAHTKVDITLLDPLGGITVADLITRLPRLHTQDHQLKQRFQSAEWAVTVLAAKIEGPVITKKWSSGASYTFTAITPRTYLLRVTIDLERLNGKPIKKDFIVPAQVRDQSGNLHPCVGAGCDMGEYYNYTKGDNQSLLMPVTAKSELEYIFALPLEAAAGEFIWPGMEPIKIDVN